MLVFALRAVGSLDRLRRGSSYLPRVMRRWFCGVQIFGILILNASGPKAFRVFGGQVSDSGVDFPVRGHP